MSPEFLHPLWIPFTRAELVRAYRVLGNADEASVLVDQLAREVRAEAHRLVANAIDRQRHEHGPSGGTRLDGLAVSVDTLAALSLMGPELERRVNSLLADALEHRDFREHWLARRAELERDARRAAEENALGDGS
jgi:hypothetical protein